MMQDCLSGLFSKKNSTDLLVSYNDQLCKERSHNANWCVHICILCNVICHTYFMPCSLYSFNQSENDHDKTKMAYLVYKHSTSPLQDLLDFHVEIVDRKKKALEKSTVEIAKWEEKIAALEAEMLVAESDEIAAGFESGAMSANNSVPAASNTNASNDTNITTNGSEGSEPDEESMKDVITEAVNEIVDNHNEYHITNSYTLHTKCQPLGVRFVERTGFSSPIYFLTNTDQ